MFSAGIVRSDNKDDEEEVKCDLRDKVENDREGKSKLKEWVGGNHVDNDS